MYLVGSKAPLEHQRELRNLAHEHHLLGWAGPAAPAQVQRIRWSKMAAAFARLPMK